MVKTVAMSSKIFATVVLKSLPRSLQNVLTVYSNSNYFGIVVTVVWIMDYVIACLEL